MSTWNVKFNVASIPSNAAAASLVLVVAGGDGAIGTATLNGTKLGILPVYEVKETTGDAREATFYPRGTSRLGSISRISPEGTARRTA